MTNVHLSRRVSLTMDHFGYGARQREFRRLAYMFYDENMNRRESGRVTNVTVGSKGEGITNMYESDIDTLMISKDVICLERNCHPPFLKDHISVLVCDTDLCYYGHTFLEVVRPDADHGLYAVFVPNGNKYYASSSAFSEILSTVVYENQRANPSCETQVVNGPALTYRSNGLDHDFVPVLPCYCPSLQQAWRNRPRFYDWPSPELRQRVVSHGAVVAPTSHTVSINKRLEWRICFNQGETELVKSFNDTHNKLYILLKIVKKDVLKPDNKEITSYVMKNIVFWLAEFNPQGHFSTDSLVDWLLKALGFLHQAIVHNNLPYYMIPERNLLAGKMLPHQRDTMLTRLDDAIHSGSTLLLQCGRLGRALAIANPERLKMLGNTRKELEMMILIMLIRRLELTHTGMTAAPWEDLLTMDNIYITCNVRCADIVLPGWIRLGLSGFDIDSIIKERVQSILK